MLKNYLKIALRTLSRHKAYSLLIVSGLALGLAVFMLAVLHAGFNFSYDTFHKNADRIYGVVQVLPSENKGEIHNAITPAPLLPSLANEFPEIEDSSRFSRCRKLIVKSKEKKFYENNILFVDSNFLSFFTFEMTSGSQKRALSKPYSIVLSEDSAIKYFGDEDPMGKTLTLNNKIDVTITGIIKNFPLNSSIRYDFLVSMETARSLYDWMEDWSINSQAAFIRLHQGFKPGDLEEKFPDFIQKHFADSPDSPKRLYLIPLLGFRKKAEDMEFYSYLLWDEPFVVSYFLIGMAFTLLLVVCINFMNLSTARYALRAKEVGVRKIVGAQRFHLIKQFLGESIVISIVSIPSALILYEFIRPAYLSYIGSDMDLSLWHYPWLWIGLFGGTILIGIFAGSYPAFFLSSFNPAHIIKGNFRAGRKGTPLRKILVVSQFGLSIVFIVFTIAIKNQLGFLKNLDFGHERSGVLIVSIPEEVRSDLEVLKKELSKHPDIGHVSAARYLPINWWPENQVIPEGFDAEKVWTMNTYGIDYGFIELLEMKISQGRSFSKDYSDTENYILNETAVRHLNWEDPIGRQLEIGGRKGMVIGVAQDFLFNNPHWKIPPAVLYLETEQLNYLYIKTLNVPVSSIINHIREQWKIFAPDSPFDCFALDHRFEDANKYIDKMSLSFGAIGVFAIFISCMGLVALASYTVGRKTKEIGVRKVLGASAAGITSMLLSYFIKLVVIANIIAWPLTFFLLKKFLQFGWAYTTDIAVIHFIFAAFLSLFTAVLSVVCQTIKVARANPVDALRYE